jgi:hypothetical protein
VPRGQSRNSNRGEHRRVERKRLSKAYLDIIACLNRSAAECKSCVAMLDGLLRGSVGLWAGVMVPGVLVARVGTADVLFDNSLLRGGLAPFDAPSRVSRRMPNDETRDSSFSPFSVLLFESESVRVESVSEGLLSIQPTARVGHFNHTLALRAPTWSFPLRHSRTCTWHKLSGKGMMMMI